MLSRTWRLSLRPIFKRRPITFITSWLRGNGQGSASRHQLRHITMESSSNSNRECVSEDDLFSYKAQRWLWNESEQLRRRYLKFNLEALIRVAEEVSGPTASCAEITKLPEGNFNKTFLVSMHDGNQLIARLPNPNSGRAYYTTASEVATMEYVRTRLQIPVPKVLTYSAKAKDNHLGAEYIIMEKCPGIELGRVWDGMSGRDRMEVVRQLADFSVRLSKSRFPFYGSLYYTKDLLETRSMEVDEIFSVGPTTGRSWFDDGRAEIDIDRGPWDTVGGVMTAVVNREIACLDTMSRFPRDRQQGIFNGPDGFSPSKASKMAVIQDLRRILHHVLPKHEAHRASILWHNDLHSDNIFVNKDKPTQITGIIDWQGVTLNPAFLHVHYPSLIEFDGPILEGYELPKLPSNFAELDSDAKRAARALRTSQSLWGLYQIFVHKQAPDLISTLRYRDHLTCQLMSLIGSCFDDGEAYVQSLLDDLVEPEMWQKIVGAEVTCPLTYSHDERVMHKEELAKWEKDVERKAGVLRAVGAYTGWDGVVSPEDYEIVHEKLTEAREQFLNTEAKTPEEREQWAIAWPFKDG